MISKLDMHVETKLSQHFLRLLQSSSPYEFSAHESFNKVEFDEARQIAVQYSANQRNAQEIELQRSNDALVNARMNALEQTYRIKSERVKDFLRSASDPRIVRMREGQLRNIETKYHVQVNELEQQRLVSVSYSLELGGLARIIEKPIPEGDAPSLQPEKEPVPDVYQQELAYIQSETTEKIDDKQVAQAGIPDPGKDSTRAVKQQPDETQTIPDKSQDMKEEPSVPAPDVQKPREQPRIPDPDKFTQIFSLRENDIKKLTQLPKGIRVLLSGSIKSPVENIMVATKTRIIVDQKKCRLRIEAPSKQALNTAIRMLQKAVK